MTTLVLMGGCLSRHNENTAERAAGDTLSVAQNDSLIASEPWLVYTYPERQGKHLFEHYCAVCHGETGAGDGFNSFNLNPKPHDMGDSAYIRDLTAGGTLLQIIRLGGRALNMSNEMPAYQYTLTSGQIDEVEAYILTLSRHPVPAPR